MEHQKIADILTEYTQQHVCNVKMEPFSGIAVFGCYSPSKKEIQLAPRLTDTMRLTTLLHELGHAIMHQQTETLSRAQVEFQADAFCLMLSQHLGLDIPDAQKRHLTQVFTKLKNEYIAHRKDASPEEIKNTLRECALNDLEAVNKAFNQHVKGIDEMLQVRMQDKSNAQERI